MSCMSTTIASSSSDSGNYEEETFATMTTLGDDSLITECDDSLLTELDHTYEVNILVKLNILVLEYN